MLPFGIPPGNRTSGKDALALISGSGSARNASPGGCATTPLPEEGKAGCRARSGGVLLVVLGTMALVLSLVVTATVVFQSRLALANKSLRRESARDTLLMAVSNAVDVLLADTNGVDSLDETWADSETFFPGASPFRAKISDEGARIPLATADASMLAALLGDVRDEGVELSEEAIRGHAEALVQWRDGWKQEHSGEAPPSFAFYANALVGPPALAECLRRGGTAFGGGPVNVNTAAPEVLEAVLEAAGASKPLAREMVRNALAARERGAVVGTVTRRTLSALFLGEGAMPTSQQAEVLSQAGGMLGVSSGLFRGRFACANPVVEVEFVYDREAKRFVSWREGP